MKKFITFVLTAAMAVSALGVTVFAEDAAPAGTPAATEPAEGDKAEDPAAPAEGDKADENAAPAEGDKADENAAPAEGDKADENAAPAEGDDEEDPAPLDASNEPAPVADPTPVAPPAEKAAAVPTNAKVVIDGKEVAFAAYNIGGNNYFKLRDLAAALDGTDAEFDVVYDTELKAIKLTKKGSATPDVYTGDGKIDATVVPGSKEATLSTRRIILPTGAWLDATDAKMTGYNIDGFTYFKLREVADVIIFSVDWDKDAKVITITTSDELGDGEAPADDAAAAPADDATAPADDATAPADDATAPADDTTAPADDATAPADDTTAPADDAAKAPADDAAKAPADDTKNA